jgi:hypothetical protein
MYSILLTDFQRFSKESIVLVIVEERHRDLDISNVKFAKSWYVDVTVYFN